MTAFDNNQGVRIVFEMQIFTKTVYLRKPRTHAKRGGSTGNVTFETLDDETSRHGPKFFANNPKPLDFHI